MKLSDENYRRLTGMIWRERLKTWGLGALAVCAVITALVVIQQFAVKPTDPVVQVSNSEATVVAVTPAPVGRGVTLKLRLPDGQKISAVANLRVYPTQGSHVRVSDVRHASGRHTYSVLGIAQ
ncbi:MAG: hypothetical protein KDJ36_08205 [Hyphomicrobiaceae bacterium]|nr:hypothetical protein [Hyphomicrobiaceae bacterium]